MTITKDDFIDLFEHRLSESQMLELLTSLKLDETMSSSLIATAANVMREKSIVLDVALELKSKLIDVVGTGGDKSGSFNVSSTVSIVLAAAGAYVAKHGNRSITSKSGSADVLENLGVRLNLTPEQNTKLLEECGFAFLFAQYHHPAMKFIMPIRKQIPEKTIFNILGPLTNPVGLSKILLGVFEPDFVPKMAEAAREMGMKSVIAVSSYENMDEISISSNTYGAFLKNGNIEYFDIIPEDLGITKVDFNAIKGGDAIENATIMHNVFHGNATKAQRDMVLINSAYALVAEGMARDAKEGMEIAKEVLDSGKAAKKLEQIIEVSEKL